MVFSSHLFIFYFLPLSLVVYYALFRAPQRWRNFVLIVFGYAFYGWAEPRFYPADVWNNLARLAGQSRYCA